MISWLENLWVFIREHIEIYKKIAEGTGVPPEVVAVIHYRENSDEFIQNAIEAIRSKQYCIYAYNLSYDSNDIVAMVCFAEAYNGMGCYNNDFISAYSYSGTDVYVSGKYISDGDYDQNVIDQQVGTYRLLLAAVAGIYDVEDGKNYVNKMCGGDIL